MEHILQSEMTLPLPRERVFAFFSEAGNLKKITPPELGFTIVTPPDVVIRKDTRLEYKLRLFGIRFGWVSRILVWEPPIRFVDEQIRGPYKQWIHEHTFEEAGGGSATITRDRVRYRLPLEPFGDIAYPLVRLQLGRIFAYRSEAVSGALQGRS
jgi:ligand-binding SRPBCC domain-containing protein